MNAQQKRRLTELIRAAIETSDLTPYEIAKRSGVDKASLSRFIAGDRSLSLESIEKLAPELGLEITAKRTRAAKKKANLKKS